MSFEGVDTLVRHTVLVGQSKQLLLTFNYHRLVSVNRDRRFQDCLARQTR